MFWIQEETDKSSTLTSFYFFQQLMAQLNFRAFQIKGFGELKVQKQPSLVP